jgi:cell wall-associated NlpC family hydrolase
MPMARGQPPRHRKSVTFVSTTRANPDRVEVRDENENWVATFTVDAYTVTLAGPARTLTETSSGAPVSVTHSTWVRAAPGPFAGEVDERWLRLALQANTAGVPDAIGLSMQYLKGAPPVMLGDLQIAGDASYGPLGPDGKRKENSDFNDYLQLRWLYPAESPDPPEKAEAHCLDCSGYMRIVWGYRHHLPESGYPDQVPLSRTPRAGLTLPRRSFQIYAEGPGIVVVPNAGTQVSGEVIDSHLVVGDLVFFDLQDDPGLLDHVGMYVGRDADGDHRFISSRKTIDGPTIADVGGRSTLNGTGTFAKAFRAARRI